MARRRRPRGARTGLTDGRALNVEYREATAADAGAIALLHAESWRAHYRGAYPDAYLDGPVYDDRAEVWHGRLSSPPSNQFVIIAGDGQELVGFACAYGADDEAYGTLLDNLHVRPDLHRSGIGRRLAGEVARWTVATHPGHGMYLWVLAQNDNARRFYARLGGRDVGSKQAASPTGGTGVEARRIVWTHPEELVSET